jgi:hypothetical protein
MQLTSFGLFSKPAFGLREEQPTQPPIVNPRPHPDYRPPTPLGPQQDPPPEQPDQPNPSR